MPRKSPIASAFIPSPLIFDKSSLIFKDPTFIALGIANISKLVLVVPGSGAVAVPSLLA